MNIPDTDVGTEDLWDDIKTWINSTSKELLGDKKTTNNNKQTKNTTATKGLVIKRGTRPKQRDKLSRTTAIRGRLYETYIQLP